MIIFGSPTDRWAAHTVATLASEPAGPFTATDILCAHPDADTVDAMTDLVLCYLACPVTVTRRPGMSIAVLPTGSRLLFRAFRRDGKGSQGLCPHVAWWAGTLDPKERGLAEIVGILRRSSGT